MLTITKPVNNLSAERLVKLWAKRYLPDLSISSESGTLGVLQLVDTASPEGRAKTVAKLQRVIKHNCEFAGIKTTALFAYIPNIVNLSEAKRLAECVWHVYEKALDIYKLQSPPLSALTTMPTVGINLTSKVSTEWALPMLERLIVLQPLLMQLRERFLLATDPRTIGFMTTQFHFSTKLVFKHLTPAEQVLLSPYFKFIEEQVCIPLQRLCTAAARHAFDSPTLAVVEQLLPASNEIAKTVYQRCVEQYPKHHSRRGSLNDLGVKASTIRDLEMFQGYLWLCVLEESMAALEQELLPLCVIVFPSLGVTWELVRQMLQILGDELQARVKLNQQCLFLPYTQAMQQMFSNVKTTIV